MQRTIEETRSIVEIIPQPLRKVKEVLEIQGPVLSLTLSKPLNYVVAFRFPGGRVAGEGQVSDELAEELINSGGRGVFQVNAISSPRAIISEVADEVAEEPKKRTDSHARKGVVAFAAAADGDYNIYNWY